METSYVSAREEPQYPLQPPFGQALDAVPSSRCGAVSVRKLGKFRGVAISRPISSVHTGVRPSSGSSFVNARFNCARNQRRFACAQRAMSAAERIAPDDAAPGRGQRGGAARDSLGKTEIARLRVLGIVD